MCAEFLVNFATIIYMIMIFIVNFYYDLYVRILDK